MTINLDQVFVPKEDKLLDVNGILTNVKDELDAFFPDVNNSNVIDDTFVNTFNIQNNQSIGQIIKYDTLKSGVHKITLMNRKNSQYSNFVYNESFLIEKITPSITINYQKVQKNIENNLTITVFENQENFTQAISGKISVIIGDELIIDNDRLINGMYTFKHTFKNKGQYPK